MILHLKEIKSALEAAQAQGVSMRRRLMLYLFAIMLFFALLIAVLLFLFGAVDPIGSEMEWALTNQLENSVNFIEAQSNDQAAYAVAFSQQLTSAIRDELVDSGITFDQLRNAPDALTSVQDSIFEVVYNNMQLAPCSGAFCFLNTTVNDTLPNKSYQGLYLKFANLSAENTIHNDVCLFRGFPRLREKTTSISTALGSWKTKKDCFQKLIRSCLQKARTFPRLTHLHPFIGCPILGKMCVYSAYLFLTPVELPSVCAALKSAICILCFPTRHRRQSNLIFSALSLTVVLMAM